MQMRSDKSLKAALKTFAELDLAIAELDLAIVELELATSNRRHLTHQI
jgi:hypothetical protein